MNDLRRYAKVYKASVMRMGQLAITEKLVSDIVELVNENGPIAVHKNVINPTIGSKGKGVNPDCFNTYFDKHKINLHCGNSKKTGDYLFYLG